MSKAVTLVIGLVLLGILVIVGQVAYGFFSEINRIEKGVDPKSPTTTDPEELISAASPDQRGAYFDIKSHVQALSRSVAIYMVDSPTPPPCNAADFSIEGLTASMNASNQCVLKDSNGIEVIYSYNNTCAKLSAESNLSDNMYINEDALRPGIKETNIMDLCD